MTPSEKFVADLCQKSFLPFWSFPNPLGKKGKELCDVFVVCENHIIIISVKDTTVSNHPDENVQYERWTKKAIHESADQIYGAERFLNSVDEIPTKNRSRTVKLPKKGQRIIHRIAIAFGSKPEFPLETGNFGKGFIHVFDEKSTWIVINELDTITDFTNYLIAKEKFIADKRILIPTEADFLALYLQTGLDIPYPADLIVSGTGLWEDYQKSKEYSDWKKDIQASFIWDRLIEQMYDYQVNSNGQVSPERMIELEESVRTINLEPRINRIELGSVLENAFERKVSARMIRPIAGSNHSYVLMPLTDKNWEEKDKELMIRCFVARVENPEAEIVVGIALGENSQGESHFDVCYLRVPELDDEFVKNAKIIQEELGYFSNPKISHSKEFRK